MMENDWAAGRWGGEPVRLTVGTDLVRVPPIAPGPQVGSEPVAAAVPYPLADLLSSRRRDSERRVGQLLDAGLSSTASRRVVVGSLFGGTGVSTLAALLADVWDSVRVPSVLLDTTGQLHPGLQERITDDVLAGKPAWLDLATVDRAALVEQFAAVARYAPTRPGEVPASVLVTGDAVAPVPGDVVQRVVSAAAESWPLVIVDAGSDHCHLDDLVGWVAPEVVILVCRPSAVELRVTADWLRARSSWPLDCRQSAVVAVVGAQAMRTRSVSAAMTVASDVAAGSVRVDTAADLTVRDVPVSGRTERGRTDPAVRLLAAGISVAPKTR